MTGLSPRQANHPTLFQDVNTWFKSLQIENTLPLPVEHTQQRWSPSD